MRLRSWGNEARVGKNCFWTAAWTLRRAGLKVECQRGITFRGGEAKLAVQGRLSTIYRGTAVPDSMLNALYTSSRTCQEAGNFHFPVLSEAQTLNDLLKAEIAFRVEMAQLQKPGASFHSRGCPLDAADCFGSS